MRGWEKSKLVSLPLPRPAKAARKVWVASLQGRKECLVVEIIEYTISPKKDVSNKTKTLFEPENICAQPPWLSSDLRGV